MHSTLLLLLPLLPIALANPECAPNSACDNEVARCGGGWECSNPSGQPLGGCCLPTELLKKSPSSSCANRQHSRKEREATVSAFVRDNCGADFACDNGIAACWEHSQCVNPSGQPLGGCCIPSQMDPEEWLAGVEKMEKPQEKKISQWEHLRGEIADYVIDNCGPAFACDNTNYGCGEDSKCINPSGEMLSGCCIPANMDEKNIETGKALPEEGTEKEGEKKISQWEHLRGEVADFVIDNCGPAFACDNTNYGCGADSKCINPSGEMLSGCCIPANMDENNIETGKALNEKEGEKKISQWEHLRGEVADFVIDNCGPAFACDNTNYGCGEDSKCINPSGEMLSGCCIPANMDPTNIEQGLPIVAATAAAAAAPEVADFVAEHCGVAFACDSDSTYGCGAGSKCVNPSGEMLAGCCIPENMDPSEIKRGLTFDDVEREKKGPLNPESMRGLIADYVADNCGMAFACDNSVSLCDSESDCINPSGEPLSGCCVPKGMTSEDLEATAPKFVKDTAVYGSLNGIDLQTLIHPYVKEYCGPAFACDSIGATCGPASTCINPSDGMLSGCCVPAGMTREELEGKPKDDSEFGPNMGTLNGIDLHSLIAPYVKEHCGPSFACDEVGALCGADSTCINPSEGPLSGCCVPAGMTREELETGVLVKREVKVEEEKEEEEETTAPGAVCSSKVGECIPTMVYTANVTKSNKEEL